MDKFSNGSRGKEKNHLKLSKKSRKTKPERDTVKTKSKDR